MSGSSAHVNHSEGVAIALRRVKTGKTLPTIYGHSVPAHPVGYISRSVAGSYDNEAVAIFALITTFYLWQPGA
eukprot:1159320-Pelagomonas_calceolata.AAC.11